MVLTDTCLTDEELAAFIDDMVPPEERERVIQHLASCASCREIYTATQLFQEEERSEEVAGPGPLPFVRKRPARRWLASALPAAAAAAFAAILLPLFFSNPARFDPNGLIGGLHLARNSSLAESATAEPVKRGPSEGPRLQDRSRDFQAGVRLIGLLVNLESNSAPRAENILRDLDSLTDESFWDNKERLKVLWGSCRQAVKENSRPALLQALARVQAEEKKMRESSDREKFPELRFGEWTEASRLAAVGRLSDYFRRRDFRRYLDWIQKQKDISDFPGAAPALKELERTLSSGQPTPDFARLQDQFNDIIKAYRRTEAADDSSDPTGLGR
ncbi:MAG TPA: zf-HC2 domain-containing protein [Thermoanaerobaculia bacterium]